MHILLVSANFRPSVGGIERFVEILAQGLAERDHDVTVVACRTRGAPVFEEDGAVRIVRMSASDAPRTRLGVPYPIPGPRAAIRTLRSLVGGSDVVHAQDALYLTTIASLGVARRLAVPSVLTQHVGFVPQQNAVLDLAQRAAIASLGRAARLANVVTAYNPSVADWARGQWGLRDVRLLPIGVTAYATSAEERLTIRRELGLPVDGLLALFAGRDVPKKRLDVFLDANDPAYHLAAVTDRRGAAPPHSHLVPFMPPARFGRLLASADAFVLPSDAEGFPLALQEALVAGVPCIVTRGPGYERYLSEGDAVFVEPRAAEIRQALLRLGSDDAWRRELAARARSVGEREFGVDGFVGAYERLYEELSRVASMTSVDAFSSEGEPSRRTSHSSAGKRRA